MTPDQTNYQPQSELPRPQPADVIGGVDQRATSADVEPAASAELPQQGGAATMPPVQVGSAPQQTATAPIMNAAATANTPVPVQGALTANDTDLIEKEWVERAKSIVDQTKDNPHMQNKAMSKFKADYVKKRYNKELKVTEG